MLLVKDYTSLSEQEIQEIGAELDRVYNDLKKDLSDRDVDYLLRSHKIC